MVVTDGPGDYEIEDDDELCEEYDMLAAGNYIDDSEYDMVLYDKVSPMDIVQGELGDCWLLSAFASVAEYPEFVRQICEDKGDNHYVVTLHSFAEGQAKTYAINDAIPHSGNAFAGYGIAYCNASKKNEIWPCVLEKAFAKMAGGYQYLDGSFSFWAFAAMTGCMDVELIELDDNDGLWKVYPVTLPESDNPQILNETQDWYSDEEAEDLTLQELMDRLEEYDNNKYLMCVASNAAAGLSDHDKSALNIHYGHAYTILQVANQPCGVDCHIIKLRNPWGSSEFKGGAWCDGAQEWTDHPDVAAELEYKDKKDGAFWMGMDDFNTAYHQIFVCKKNMEETPHTDAPGQAGGVKTRGINLFGAQGASRGPDPVKKTNCLCQ